MLPDQVAKLGEIMNLIAQGNKIAAIKLYREVFDTSLTKAKEAVDHLADDKIITQVSVVLEGEAVHPRDGLVEAEIHQLIQEGKKIEAIKRYRETYHAGLKESKDAVEVYETSGVLPVPTVTMGGGTTQEMIDAFQKLAESANAENSTISVQASGVDMPIERAGRISSRFDWWLTCGIVFILLTVIVPILFAMTSHGGPLEGLWARVNPFAYARVSLTFGEEGSGPGLLDNPGALTVDPSGNLYVANNSDGRIQKFDPSGKFMFLWNIGTDTYISGLAANRFGNTFVVHGGEIWRYDSTTGKSAGLVDNPDERWFDVVAASPDGSLVAATNTEDIVRFDVDSHQVFSRVESAGGLLSQAEEIEDIAVDAVGNIYLLSDSSSSIIKYAPDGRLLIRFGSEGDEKGQLDFPNSIAVDGQGRIYVGDSDGIKVFAPDGRYLDQFNVPGGVAFDIEFNHQGDLWVMTSEPKLVKFNIPGP